ncbi:MAG: hypothetical protein ABIM89_06720 [Mycobacteriales bacterium]
MMTRIPTPRTRSIALVAITCALVGGGTQIAWARSSMVTEGTPTFSRPGRIDNRYLPLTKFSRCELSGINDEGVRERSVKTLLKTTKTFVVDGKRVEAVTIQDDAFDDGKLVETTLDYYGQSDDGTVYYFGEQVKNIKSGKVINTKGTWLYGKDTDRLGVAMPAIPVLGSQWHFEDVPGLTTESNRVEEVGLRTKVGGKIVNDVIRVQEFIQPEGVVEYKLYAAGIGTVAEYPPGGRVFYVSCR